MSGVECFGDLMDYGNRAIGLQWPSSDQVVHVWP